MTSFTDADAAILAAKPSDLDNLAVLLPKWRLLLGYEPDTGLLIWKLETPTEFNRGACVATYQGAGGVGMVRVDGFRVLAARVVWLLHHGRWPVGKLRRKDLDRSNDRIENLIESPTPRPKGVARYGAKWQAYVRNGYVQKFLGVFATEAEAAAARAAYDRGEDLV